MTTRTRREFCTQACQMATLAGALATILEGCSAGGGGGNGTLPSDVPTLATVSGAPAAGGGVSVTVDAGSPLASVGSAALVQSANGLFLVAHTGDNAFTALTATCTHQACTIIGYTGGTYVCPCHGSRFSTSGAVQNGPATRSLRSFPTQLSGNVLTISV